MYRYPINFSDSGDSAFFIQKDFEKYEVSGFCTVREESVHKLPDFRTFQISGTGIWPAILPCDILTIVCWFLNICVLRNSDPAWSGYSDYPRAAPRHTGQEQGQQGVRLSRTQATPVTYPDSNIFSSCKTAIEE